MSYIITFSTTHDAMGGEMAVNDVGKSRLISTPPTISAGCGLALLVEDGVSKILDILKRENISYSGVYEKVGIQEYKNMGGHFDISR